MATRYALFALVTAALLSGCFGKPASHKLSPARFRDKMGHTRDAVLLDVRQPEEYVSGHIRNAINIPWNGAEFMEQAARLDKNKTLFVYCLTGGRSDPAAEVMREMGFRKVYELEGGILKWRAAGLPQVGDVPEGMTVEQFNNRLLTTGTTLVFYHAAWNKQSQKLYPIVRELTGDTASDLKLLAIDVDTNQFLTRAVKVDAIPTIRIYHQGRLTWQHTGCTNADEITRHLPLKRYP